MKDFDICIIGSGAGGGPVALELARAGYSVAVLEKGPWFTEKDFFKDEQASSRHNVYTPSLNDEQHVIEEQMRDGSWQGEATSQSGWDFWNGNMVGGSSNLMSGFFYRLKPEDFRLLSEFGPIKNANIADWPISYTDLEPYYTKAETEVGISGRVVKHPFQEPRSTKDFPFPATAEHILATHIDQACEQLGMHAVPTPRAILTTPYNNRRSCEYSGYCGSYGCASGAKGSSRAALLDRAVLTSHCSIIPNAKVYRLNTDAKGNIASADYYDASNATQSIHAQIFVVACQAVETSRLLLSSTSSKHPNGIGNNNQQLGKNLLFSGGGSGYGDFNYAQFDPATANAMKAIGPFVNRGVQDWYVINDKKLGRVKGGTIDFLLRHPNPIAKATPLKRDDNDKLVWGKALQQKLKSLFVDSQYLRFEVFNDWLPTDNCFVALDNNVKDRWGSAVGKVRIGYHPHDLIIGRYLSDHAERVLKQMGASNIRSNVSGSPPQNLMAGGCRFGNDIKTSVLNADCRVHDVDNLYVTDGSFMPTGGSVPYTWTIYANAFRVADIIKSAI